MATQEQLRDAEGLRRRIARGQFTSVMNNTKWRELLDLLKCFEGALRFRRKDVGEPDPALDAWCGELCHELGGWQAIEWIEIDAREVVPRGQLLDPEIRDRTTVLKSTLAESGIPFSVEDGQVRVWGYVAPGSSPSWERAV